VSGARSRRARKREQLLERVRELAEDVAEARTTPRWPHDAGEDALELSLRYTRAIAKALLEGCELAAVAEAAELPLSAVWKAVH